MPPQKTPPRSHPTRKCPHMAHAAAFFHRRLLKKRQFSINAFKNSATFSLTPFFAWKKVPNLSIDAFFRVEKSAEFIHRRLFFVWKKALNLSIDACFSRGKKR